MAALWNCPEYGDQTIGDEQMLATALLTPMILAVEPVRLEMLDQTYDHQTQTSTFTGNPDKRLRLAWSHTSTSKPCVFGNQVSVCADGDND